MGEPARPVRGVPGGWRDWWNADDEAEIDELRLELVRQERLIRANARSESAGIVKSCDQI